MKLSGFAPGHKQVGHLIQELITLEAFSDVALVSARDTGQPGQGQKIQFEILCLLDGEGSIHSGQGYGTLQAERLYSQAEQYAELTGDEVVWDLYCGTGTISLFLASKAAEVVGVELNTAAVEDARKNARDNGIENATFVTSDIIDFLKPEGLGNVPEPDVIITDPPRPGLHGKVVKSIGS